MEYIRRTGFLPLLNLGVYGWSAEDVVDDDCRYHVLPDGEGWEWPLWQWKGEIIQSMGCAYGKFFRKKAAFITKEWWPDFCNYRRSLTPPFAEDSTEGMILEILRANGSMISRDLRKACGFTEKGMRGKFDSIITRLQMAGLVVTEDFVYPHDRHGRQYGWGWALLSTAENFMGKETCHPNCSPEASRQRLLQHFKQILPEETDQSLAKLIL